MERLRCLSAIIKLTLRGVNDTERDANGMGVMDCIGGRAEVEATGGDAFEDLRKNIDLDVGWGGCWVLEVDSDAVEEEGVEYIDAERDVVF